MSNVVSQGNEITILYTGKLKDGTIFDSTDDKAPFKFIAGSPEVIKGINDSVMGMKVGDKKNVEIQPDNAYGQYNDELLAKIPKDKLPKDVAIGDILTDTDNNRWWIRNIVDDYAILDGNHPLAGQVLIFEIELIAIS